MLMKRRSVIICLSLAVLLSIPIYFLVKAIEKNGKTSDATANVSETTNNSATSNTPAASDSPSATNTPEAMNIPATTNEPATTNAPAANNNETEVTISPGPTDTSENIITVHNAAELAANFGSGRHIRLMPGNNYNLTYVFGDGCRIQEVNDLTIEGMGETPVVIYTEFLYSDVMSFSNCSNVTLINLELTHTRPLKPNDSCEGRVICFYGDNTNITIKNCILSGCGTTGLYAAGISNLVCEDTVIRNCSESLMDLRQMNNASFERCTFDADYSRIIKIDDSGTVTFADCLFTGEHSQHLPKILNRDITLLETSDESFYGEIVNMEQEYHGFLIRDSVLCPYDSAELFKQLKDNLSSYFSSLSGYSFRIDLEDKKGFDYLTLNAADRIRVHMKAPFVFKNIGIEYYDYFDRIMLSMKDLIIQKTDLVFELGPSFSRYPNAGEMLERYRNGERVSYLETDYIYFGELDATMIRSDNTQYLSVSEAREILLNKIPLPVSTNDFQPFIDISAVDPGTASLIYEDGSFMYLFRDFSYGSSEKFGYDGFCIGVIDGTLRKYYKDRYAAVSTADNALLHAIADYLKEIGVVIPENDWMKVQIYDNSIASVYIGGRSYFQLKIIETPEGMRFEIHKTNTQTEGDISLNVAEFPPYRKDVSIKQWNDIYNLQWVYYGETKHHWIMGKVGDILLVYGHDGGISGTHDHEYLYGLDAKTGKKVWSVYGGYLGIYYAVSRDQGKVFAAAKVRDFNTPRLLCLDIYTGDILWEKELPAMQSYDPIQVLSGDAVAFLLRSEDSAVVKVLDRKNGNLLWEKNIDKGDRFVEFNYDTPCLVLRQKDKTQALDWMTGNSLWTAAGSTGTIKDRFLFTLDGGVLKSRNDFFGEKELIERWLDFEVDFRHIDLLSGRVSDSVICDSKAERIMPVNYDYYIIIKYDVDEYNNIREVKSFSLYSTLVWRNLWEKDEALIGATLLGNELIYITNSSIKSVNLFTGVVNWSRQFSGNIKDSKIWGDIYVYPLAADGKLIVQEQNNLFVFDPDTGERLYQVGDYSIKDYVLRSYRDSLCSVVLIDGMLYIGSDSGKVSCLKIE